MQTSIGSHRWALYATRSQRTVSPYCRLLDQKTANTLSQFAKQNKYFNTRDYTVNENERKNTQIQPTQINGFLGLSTDAIRWGRVFGESDVTGIVGRCWCLRRNKNSLNKFRTCCDVFMQRNSVEGCDVLTCKIDHLSDK